MALPAHQLLVRTYRDLATMPEDGNRYELIGGEIVMSPAPRVKHQTAVLEFAQRLNAHAREHTLGRVVISPVDVRFDAYNEVQPDIVFVRAGRLSIVGRDLIEGVPDVTVEVLSPSNRQQDLLRKAALYASFGVPEYWILDPENDSVTLFALVEGQYVTVPNVDGVSRSTVINGFEISASEIFPFAD